ncbi:MAG: hypothetical protein AAF533_26665 [Acidobacteriota bacterium]
MSSRERPLLAAAWWGVLGFLALIVKALWMLTPIALAAFRSESMGALHWVLAAAWIVFMIYSEGYRGFHQAFSPRLAARALHLAHHPRPLHVALAPAYVMGLMHATRKRLIVSWCLLLGIVALVIGVRMLSQPWRGIVDAGVVLGLTVGGISVVYHFHRQLGGAESPKDPDVPEPA